MANDDALVETLGAIRNVLYRHLPQGVDANVCRAIADDLLSLSRNGWQTMDSAPKDGSEFIMLDANVKTATVGHWMGDVEWRNVGKKIGEAIAEPGWFPLATPTHWQPLPAPPLAVSERFDDR